MKKDPGEGSSGLLANISVGLCQHIDRDTKTVIVIQQSNLRRILLYLFDPYRVSLVQNLNNSFGFHNLPGTINQHKLHLFFL